MPTKNPKPTQAEVTAPPTQRPARGRKKATPAPETLQSSGVALVCGIPDWMAKADRALARADRAAARRAKWPVVSLLDLASAIRREAGYPATRGYALCACGALIGAYNWRPVEVAPGEPLFREQPPEAKAHVHHGGFYRVPGLGRHSYSKVYCDVARAWARDYQAAMKTWPGVSAQERADAKQMVEHPEEVEALLPREQRDNFENWLLIASTTLALRWLDNLAQFSNAHFNPQPSPAALDSLATLALMDVPLPLGPAAKAPDADPTTDPTKKPLSDGKRPPKHGRSGGVIAPQTDENLGAIPEPAPRARRRSARASSSQALPARASVPPAPATLWEN